MLLTPETDVKKKNNPATLSISILERLLLGRMLA
jgi:hypothetical protein